MPVSVRRIFMNAFKGNKNLKLLHAGQYLEFKPQSRRMVKQSINL